MSQEHAPYFVQIIHDDSCTMANDKWRWDAIKSPDAPGGLVGHGDHRMVRYPLNLSETRFENSRAYSGDMMRHRAVASRPTQS